MGRSSSLDQPTPKDHVQRNHTVYNREVGCGIPAFWKLRQEIESSKAVRATQEGSKDPIIHLSFKSASL